MKTNRIAETRKLVLFSLALTTIITNYAFAGALHCNGTPPMNWPSESLTYDSYEEGIALQCGQDGTVLGSAGVEGHAAIGTIWFEPTDQDLLLGTEQGLEYLFIASNRAHSRWSYDVKPHVRETLIQKCESSLRRAISKSRCGSGRLRGRLEYDDSDLRAVCENGLNLTIQERASWIYDSAPVCDIRGAWASIWLDYFNTYAEAHLGVSCVCGPTRPRPSSQDLYCGSGDENICLH